MSAMGRSVVRARRQRQEELRFATRDGKKDEHEKFVGERSDSRGAWICGCRATSKPAGIKKSTAIWAGSG